MTKSIISTPLAPAPAHLFHQAVRKGPFLQVSGQGPIDPTTGTYVHMGDVKAQTVRTLENVAAIVEAAGARFDDVLMLRVYLTSAEDFAAMNEAYGAFVAERSSDGVLPSRTTVIAGLPHPDMLVEIDAFAVI